MATTTYGTPYVAGTDLVANWPAASLTVADSIDAAGYFVGRGINAQVASYTTIITDAGKTISMTAAGANTVTIPANSSVAYVVGTRINILNLGAGACTPTAGAGVTINGTITALATNSSASVIKTATNTWSYVPFGSGAPTLTSADVTSTTGSPTITTSGGRTIYAFSGSGTIVLGKAGLCDLLVVGGGGAATRGAGGAGGMLPLTSAYLQAGTLTVTVGAGGTIASGYAVRGLDSRLDSFYAIGGGNGTRIDAGFIGQSGGSGAGGYYNSASAAGGTGTGGQGNNGGAATGGNAAGGGGGASAVGASVSANAGGAGGAGSANSITGSSVTYAGGGGGYGFTTAGAGGAGGGGAGTTGANGTAGSVNTGGGAGGGTTGSAGGSGIIIVSVVT
jgi:hypothetical protein